LIRPVVEKLIKEGKVVRGWLGVTISSLRDLKEDVLENVPDRLKSRGGAYVVDTMPDGPAEESGIEKADIILAIDGRAVAEPAELIGIISSKEPGTSVKCTIWRDGEEKTIKIKLGERPTKLTPDHLRLATRPGKKSEAYKKLGLEVSDFKGRVARMMGVSRLKAVIVDYVKPGSLADQFGITAQNIITEVNDQRVKSAADFEEIIKNADVQKGVSLTILGRFGEYKVRIKPGAD